MISRLPLLALLLVFGAAASTPVAAAPRKSKAAASGQPRAHTIVADEPRGICTAINSNGRQKRARGTHSEFRCTRWCASAFPDQEYPTCQWTDGATAGEGNTAPLSMQL